MDIYEQKDACEKPAISFGADTSDCPVECLADIIRKRAYEIYEARGRLPGHETQDWLQAEQEIKSRLNG